jgi:hypothetical protein
LITYLHDVLFHHATREEIAEFVDTYPFRNGSAGSPFGTGDKNKLYPEFKRLAALLGDVEYIMMRRLLLESIPRDLDAWSWLATWQHGTPVIGTFHTSDLWRLFYGTDPASRTLQDRYIAFVDNLDPNAGLVASAKGFRTVWPSWNDKRQLLKIGASSTDVLTDDFRSDSFEFIKAHLHDLRY